MNSFSKVLIFTFGLIMLSNQNACSQHNYQSSEEQSIKNPMSVAFIEQNLASEHPRLILTPAIDRQLRRQIETDPLVRSYFRALQADAEEIMGEPLVERAFSDTRGHMLSVSRQMKRRLSTLAIVYRYSGNPEILDRLDKELRHVCNFEDWHPGHWLDTAEMSMAVSLAIDWAGESLPEETVDLALKALIEKGIKPAFHPEEYEWYNPAQGVRRVNWFIEASNNWNQVGHGGLVASAITIAEKDPELAANTLRLSLDNLHHALEQYAPDGIYPEGATYWGYGTMYTALTVSSLRSAFDTDFGITKFPGLMESADFRLVVVAPSGEFFNFSDAGSNLRNDRGRDDHTTAWFNRGRSAQVLTWIAAETGNSLYFDPTFYESAPDDIRDRSRFGAASLVWLSQAQNLEEKRPLPLIWKGGGKNPIAVFRGGDNDPEYNPNGFYLGMKGGRASVNHGHMDVGSFVFELDGVRWSKDMGSGGVRGEVQQAGKNYWGMSQDAFRWSILQMSNRGHSTLTVDGARHNADGYAPIIDFNDGKRGGFPEATFDLSEVFEGQVAGAKRRFVKESPRSIVIEDSFTLLDHTELVTWQMMTTAEVTHTDYGALLEQDGKKLKLEIFDPEDIDVYIVSLDPPPGRFDKRIENLKRLEIRVPADLTNDQDGYIKVRLSGYDAE